MKNNNDYDDELSIDRLDINKLCMFNFQGNERQLIPVVDTLEIRR